MSVQFKVIVRDPQESIKNFEERLENVLNEFYKDIDEKDEWDYVRLLGTGTEDEPGSETFILHKTIKKSDKKVGFN